MEGDRFDAIVVGAGPAGITAAKSLANAGLSVVVLERGQFPGSKNVWGGILYREPTEAVIPGFEADAPLERPIIEQRYLLLTDDAMMGATYRSQRLVHATLQRLLGVTLALRPLVRREGRGGRGRGLPGIHRGRSPLGRRGRRRRHDRRP